MRDCNQPAHWAYKNQLTGLTLIKISQLTGDTDWHWLLQFKLIIWQSHNLKTNLIQNIFTALYLELSFDTQLASFQRLLIKPRSLKSPQKTGLGAFFWPRRKAVGSKCPNDLFFLLCGFMKNPFSLNNPRMGTLDSKEQNSLTSP